MSLMPEAEAPPRAAAVIVLRDRLDDGLEVLLVQRRARASFMAQAHVFPGGGVHGTESLAQTAQRELFEEAGLWLGDVDEPTRMAALATWRAAGPDGWAQLAAGLPPPAAMVPWARWVTPSVEPRRFDATFFLAPLPRGQTVALDHVEVVAHAWVSPQVVLTGAEGLRLAPPQLYTLHELARYRRVDEALAAATARVARGGGPALPALMPREGQDARGYCLMLPWDPAYATGQGAGVTLPEAWQAARQAETAGSRFVRRSDETWRLVAVE